MNGLAKFGIKAFDTTWGVVWRGLTGAFKMITTYHNESIKFAREAGMSLQQAHAYTKVLTTRAADLGVKYGISAQAVAELDRNLQAAVGRQLMLSNDQAEKAVQINKLVGEAVHSQFNEELITKMGAQIDSVQAIMANVYATAAKSGLNVSKMSQKVAQNLSMANRLSFRNGVDGLTRMAMMSEKLGVNMSSVESAANNFLKLENAIESSAHLQMLGGSSASMFGNPLTAAYEANYDPESFAKRMSDSLASYATFDAKKGIANINGMNMDFVRAIAEAMHISTDEAAAMAKRNAEIRYKENTYGTTLDAISGGDQMKRDMLLNMSSISGGKLGMRDKTGEWRDMSYFRYGEGKKELNEMMSMYGKSDSEILKEQASSLKTIEEQIEGIKTSIFGKIGEGLNKFNVLPRIQAFLDEKGEVIVNAVGDIVKWFTEFDWKGKWRAATNWFESIKSHFNTAITVLKWGFGIIVAKELLSGLRGLFGSKGGLGGRGPGGGNSPTGRGRGNKNHTLPQTRGYMKQSFNKTKGSVFRKALNATKTGWRNSRLIRGAVKGNAISSAIMGTIEGGMAIYDYKKQKANIENDAAKTRAQKERELEIERKKRNRGVSGAVGGAAGGAAGGVAGSLLGAMAGAAVAGTAAGTAIPGLGNIIGAIVGLGVGAAGYYLLGIVCEKLSRKNEAISAFKKSIELDPFMWCSYEKLCKLEPNKIDNNKIFTELNPKILIFNKKFLDDNYDNIGNNNNINNDEKIKIK